MIEIKDKKDCCGCNACVQICPKKCISMEEDQEGFFYPHTDASLCISCGLCEKVCPVINQHENREPLKVYAVKNLDEVTRLNSSSGGVFSVLSEYILSKGGVVFGAMWKNDEWYVEHGYIESINDLHLLQGSKYLQSRIGNSYSTTEFFLKQGRFVLFSGTPCQISGLYGFLRKKYDNLLTCEIFCHSVPSPKVWKWYLKEQLYQLHWNSNNIKDIKFRSKVNGWKSYSLAIINKDGQIFTQTAASNPFIKGFVNNLYSRPSCHFCPAKHLKSGSDFSLGDYWKIDRYHPDIDDDKGISAVLVNSEKAYSILKDLSNQELIETNFNEICLCNPALIFSSKKSNKRKKFYNSRVVSFSKLVNDLCSESLILRIKIFIYNLLRAKK